MCPFLSNPPEEEHVRKRYMDRNHPNRGNSKVRGRLNTRYNAKRDTHRLRFTSVHPDQAETIFAALELARREAGTEFDTVALDAICQHFLATYPAEHERSKNRCGDITAEVSHKAVTVSCK